MRGAKADDEAFGGVVPLIEGVLRPIKLLLLLTEVSGIGRCGGAAIEGLDLLEKRFGKLLFDCSRVGWMEDAGVEVPLLMESSVDDDLLAVPLESELLDSSLVVWTL